MRTIGHHKKAAITNALKAALQKLAIIRFPQSGKVVVRSIVASADESAGEARAPLARARAMDSDVPAAKQPRPSGGADVAAPSSAKLMPPPPPRPPQGAAQPPAAMHKALSVD